ncbi:ribonuclease inhibitor-like [Dysidea avara]|uniref:ribonuclease inhibitor-like n=1 Tax=Dysidea avara TaxID=196820 RepID=UPI00332A2E97
MARSRSNGDINTMPKMPQGSCLISLKQNMRCHSTELTAEYLAHNTIIKNIADIFRPVVSTDSEDLHPPRVILIDGALGIGKTYLCKEIAYQWSQGQILTDKRFLFLLHAHDPRLQSLKHVKDLVALFCELENEETIDMIYGHIKETQGEILTILLDGYDEFYGGLQSNHLLSRMIRCEILPKCGVVITSRSFACASLCGQADRRMEILGFTSNDRQDYIQRALEKNPADIATLTDYFDSHPTVDSLCHIPLNMTILLRLFTRNDSILPQSRTELYENFVSWTITYHIEKDEKCTKSYKEPELFHIAADDLIDIVPVTSSAKVVTISDIKIRARHSTYWEITKFVKLHPSLMALEIPKCLPKEEQFVDSLVTGIGTAPLMQEVDVYQNQLGSTGVQKIAQGIKDMPRLKSLIMRGNDINDVAAVALADSLENKIGLKVLNLCENKILSRGAIAISNSLQENKTLKVLNLQNNGIESDAAQELSCMLVSKTNLSELNLSQNNLGTEGMIIIASAPQKITTLKVLNVSSNKILIKASSDIAEVIKSNTSLEVLNVSLNKLESLGCIKLCKALQKQHPNLKVFNISSNGLKSMAANEIAHTLQDKQKLEVVNVSWNEFEGGLATIVASLKSTKLLKELTLRQSGVVNQKAVNKICQVINENLLLEVLDLGSTKLHNMGAYKIFGALKENTTLKVLNVCRNNFDDYAIQQLSVSFVNNSSLSELLLHDNPISDQVIKQFVFKILSNKPNLKNIWVPQISNERMRMEIDWEVEKINRQRAEDNKLNFSNW